MKRAVSFAEKDKELVKKIEAFREEKRLPNFTEAVRQLCADALKFKEATK